MSRIFSLAFLVILVSVLAVQAQGVEDLEELMFAEEEDIVVTAAMKAQKIAEAPAIISVLTARDLEDLGVTNLYEALSYVPGVTVIETYYGYSSVTFRGNLQTHYNNKSLLLIDGHPMYETIVGSYYLEQIPINMVRRIEVLRGPGSVLYGTNAFAGIVNVITKGWEDETFLSASGGGGTFSSILADASFGGSFGTGNYIVGGNFFDSKGYDFLVKADETGAFDPPREAIYDDDEDAYEDDFYNIMAKARIGDVSFSALAFGNDKDKMGLNPVIDQTGERRVEGLAADIKWAKELGEKASVGLFGWFDRFKKEEHIDKIAGTSIRQEYDGSKLGMEARLRYGFQEKLEFLGGVSYERCEAGPYLFVDIEPDTTHWLRAWEDEYDTYDIGAYSELSWSLSPKVGVSAGLRINNNKDYGTNVVPRAGLVVEAAKQLYAKALFGQAFRNPNFFEKHVNTWKVLYGDPELDPEKVSTVDLGLDWKVGKTSLRLNYFWMETDDLIGRIISTHIADQDTMDFPTYANGTGQTINGIESEIRGSVGPKFSYFGNISYKKGKDSETDEDLLFLAETSGNAGLTWRLSDMLQASFNLQLVGSRDGKTSAGDEFTIDSYMLSNLSLRASPLDNVTVWLKVRNLMDEEYTYPEYVRANIEEIPGGPARAVYAGISLDL